MFFLHPVMKVVITLGTFRELYNRLVDAALRNDLEKEVREITESGEYGREEVDRLYIPWNILL